MLKGTTMEDKCKSNLKKMLGYYYLVEDSNQFIDKPMKSLFFMFTMITTQKDS